MAQITKEHARKIAKKLKAKNGSCAGSVHDIALIYHDGKVVAHFGIRRGSKKNLGHGHIPRDLYLGPHDTLRLANCPLSKEQWIQMLKDQGVIVDDPQPKPNT